MKNMNKFFRKKVSILLIGLICLAAFILGLGSLELSAQKKKQEKPTTFLNKKSRVKFGEEISSLSQANLLSKIKIINQPETKRLVKNYSSEKLIVKFKPEISAQSTENILRAYQPKSFRLIPRINVYVMQVAEGTTVEETLAALRSNPDVLYAEPDYKLRLCTTPNDQLFRYQYALYNPGGVLQIPGSPTGKARADIKITGTWDYGKGDPNVLIAVLDTGVDYTHPDLANKVISTGRDFVNNDYDAFDDHWHGTHVAGIIAAETNNSEGIAGVAWNCRILPGKVISADGEGDYSWLIDALIWAADYTSGQAKVQVINMSLGGTEPSQALEEALKYAYNKGIVLVAAAGNHSAPEDPTFVLYPAAYDQYCLAVGASDYNDQIADFSNYGTQLDVAAPGVWVLSTYPVSQTEPGYLPYAFASGTSMAAPHVAGFAALIKSAKPWLTPADIVKIIKYTPDDVNSTEYPGKDDYAGYGRINTERAVIPYKITKK
ncbi:MAG: peptidase S8 [Candidatus Aminicenantes bacterium]|nr:peptidase S8 [Candidatus Aminicenantes bacterium]